jgi:RHS repeat-associated protein
VIAGTAAVPVLHYIESDHLGTPRVIVDATRNVGIWRWNQTNDPFGESTPNQNPDGDATSFTFNLRFAGQYRDSESGWYYNVHRYYDPSIGRYLESDPIGLGGGISTYSYVGAAPLTAVDPLGLEILGIHVFVSPSGSLVDAHAWISVHDDNGKLLETWGGFPPNTSSSPDNQCGCENSNVLKNYERDKGYQATISFFGKASPEEYARFEEFRKRPFAYRGDNNNCAHWVENAIEHAFPDFNVRTLDASTGSAFFVGLFGGVGTPRRIGAQLQDLRRAQPGNSPTSPGYFID